MIKMLRHIGPPYMLPIKMTAPFTAIAFAACSSANDPSIATNLQIREIIAGNAETVSSITLEGCLMSTGPTSAVRADGKVIEAFSRMDLSTYDFSKMTGFVRRGGHVGKFKRVEATTGMITEAREFIGSGTGEAENDDSGSEPINADSAAADKDKLTDDAIAKLLAEGSLSRKSRLIWITEKDGSGKSSPGPSAEMFEFYIKHRDSNYLKTVVGAATFSASPPNASTFLYGTVSIPNEISMSANSEKELLQKAITLKNYTDNTCP